MKRIALFIAVLAAGYALIANAAMVRKTTSITTSTNANVSAVTDVYGTVLRAVYTVTGGTTDLAIVDSDGTSLISTTGVTGSWTDTGSLTAYRPTVTTSNSTRNVSNVACTVSILWTVQE